MGVELPRSTLAYPLSRLNSTHGFLRASQWVRGWLQDRSVWVKSNLVLPYLGTQSWNWMQNMDSSAFTDDRLLLCCNILEWLLGGFYKDSRPVGSEANQAIHQVRKSWESWRLSSRWSLRHLLCCGTADAYPTKEFSAHYLPPHAVPAESNFTTACVTANGQSTLHMADSNRLEINICFKVAEHNFPIYGSTLLIVPTALRGNFRPRSSHPSKQITSIPCAAHFDV